MDLQWKITLKLDDRILRASRLRAAETGALLTRLIETASKSRIALDPTVSGDFRLLLLVNSGQRVPDVTLDNRDALCEKMKGRDRSRPTPTCWCTPSRRNCAFSGPYLQC